MTDYTQKIVSSRIVGNANVFVGELGRMFYNQNDGIIRLSDGITPGGIIVSSGSGGGGISSGTMQFDSGGAAGIDISINEFILDMGNAS